MNFRFCDALSGYRGKVFWSHEYNCWYAGVHGPGKFGDILSGFNFRSWREAIDWVSREVGE